MTVHAKQEALENRLVQFQEIAADETKSEAVRAEATLFVAWLSDLAPVYKAEVKRLGKEAQKELDEEMEAYKMQVLGPKKSRPGA